MMLNLNGLVSGRFRMNAQCATDLLKTKWIELQRFALLWRSLIWQAAPINQYSVEDPRCIGYPDVYLKN